MIIKFPKPELMTEHLPPMGLCPGSVTYLKRGVSFKGKKPLYMQPPRFVILVDKVFLSFPLLAKYFKTGISVQKSRLLDII